MFIFTPASVWLRGGGGGLRLRASQPGPNGFGADRKKKIKGGRGFCGGGWKLLGGGFVCVGVGV